MKKTIVFLFILFSIKSLGQNPKVDSLKIVVKELFKQPVSIQRDSLLTVSMSLINGLTPVNKSQPWVDSLYKFSKTSKWEQTIPYSQFSNSAYYYHIGYTGLAFKNLELALGLFKKYKNEKMYTYTYSNLIVLIINKLLVNPIENENIEKKYLSYFLDGLVIAKKQNERLNIANMNLALMQYYVRHKNYAESKKYAIDAWKVTETDPKKYFYYYHCGKAAEGLNLLYLGKLKEGFSLLNRIKEVCRIESENGEAKLLLGAIGVYLGEYYIEKKDFKNAIIEAKMAGEALKELNISSYNFLLNKIFYQAYKNLGKPAEALTYFEKVQAFDHEAQTKEFNSVYIEWQLKYEDEKQKNQIKTLENERLTQTRNFLLLAGLFGLSIIIYVFWNNQKLKKKNQEIQEALLHGQTTERKRMATELHDNIANKILGVKMRVETLENQNFTAQDRKNYDSILSYINEVYADIRLVSHNLMPEELEKNGLPVAVENLVKKLNLIGKTKFDSEVKTNQQRFAPRFEYEVYNIILELVNNVLKHAKAKNAVISIVEVEKNLNLSVKDNGKGFDSQAISFDSLGLKNIHSRIESLKGSINILNQNGTQILINLPV